MEARLICNSVTGGPVKSDAMWTMMKQLKTRMSRMIQTNEIKNLEEKEKLNLLKQEYETNMTGLRNDMDKKFNKILYLIQQNPGLAFIKRESIENKF